MDQPRRAADGAQIELTAIGRGARSLDAASVTIGSANFPSRRDHPLVVGRVKFTHSDTGLSGILTG